jgi:hypothetical protein
MRTYGKRTALAATFALVAGQLLAVPVLGAGPDIQPAAVEEIIFPGQSVDIEKTVTTPELPPVADICLLEDETGSFADDIGNLNAAASDIYDAIVAASPDAQFGVAGFRDYPGYGLPDDWVYRLASSMNASKVAWLAGVGTLSAPAGAGGDTPEALFDAIVAAAGPGPFIDPTLGPQADCGWRDPSSGAQRVLVAVTDAPSHIPDGTHVNDATSTIAALTAQDIIVASRPMAPSSTRSPRISGRSRRSAFGSDIADAILAGLAAVEAEVTMETCEWPISTTFDPASQVVASGDDAVLYRRSRWQSMPRRDPCCRDVARVTGELLRNDAGEMTYETKLSRCRKAFTGGGQIDSTPGKNASRSVGGMPATRRLLPGRSLNNPPQRLRRRLRRRPLQRPGPARAAVRPGLRPGPLSPVGERQLRPLHVRGHPRRGAGMEAGSAPDGLWRARQGLRRHSD